jgi:hypothetical protein
VTAKLAKATADCTSASNECAAPPTPPRATSRLTLSALSARRGKDFFASAAFESMFEGAACGVDLSALTNETTTCDQLTDLQAPCLAVFSQCLEANCSAGFVRALRPPA